MKIRIYAKKGEWVTCTNGCKVAKFTCDVFVGVELDLTKQLEYHKDQVMPPIGTPLLEFECKCGGRYVSSEYQGVFHFEDGWRQC